MTKKKGQPRKDDRPSLGFIGKADTRKKSRLKLEIGEGRKLIREGEGGKSNDSFESMAVFN